MIFTYILSEHVLKFDYSNILKFDLSKQQSSNILTDTNNDHIIKLIYLYIYTASRQQLALQAGACQC